MTEAAQIEARAREAFGAESAPPPAVHERQRIGESAPASVSEISDEPKRRGRKPGSPKVPGSGRKPGTRNLVSSELRLMILNRGRPFELLADVSRGLKVRVGPQAGPGEPEYIYPTLEQRIEAAKILAKKLLPDMASHELSGPEGSPVTVSMDDDELARRIAAMLYRHSDALQIEGKAESATPEHGPPRPSTSAQAISTTDGGGGPDTTGRERRGARLT